MRGLLDGMELEAEHGRERRARSQNLATSLGGEESRVILKLGGRPPLVPHTFTRSPCIFIETEIYSC